MRSFQQHIADFNKRGIRIVAISIDTPETNRDFRARNGFTFPLLTDPKAQVSRHYGVVQVGAGPEGVDIARPAEFLLDSSGIVRWVNLTESDVGAKPDKILKAFDRLR